MTTKNNTVDDTIVISADPYSYEPIVWNNDNMNMSTGITAQEIDTIQISDINLTATTAVDTISFPSGSITSAVYSGGTGGTITLNGIDDLYANVTKSEHNELMERVKKLEQAMTEEAELRAKHPALKTAYDEYRLLLVLSKQHTPDILTDE